MDLLQACACAYENLLNIKYRCIIGRKGKSVEFTLTFSPYEFHHLCGLNKLPDIPLLRRNRERVFRDILSGSITYDMISSSPCFHAIEKRIFYLQRLEEFMDSNKIIFSFDNRKRIASSIEAEYLLQNNFDEEVAYFFIGESKYSDSLIGISFFIMDNLDYSIGQPRWTLLYKEKIDCSSGTVTVQYDRLNKDATE